MKQLAKDLNCPVVLLSQLNRELEKRADKRPTLADLRESGAIEQDADVVIGLYQPFTYSNKREDHGKAQAIILKQRNGPVGSVDLLWTPETATFWNP
jgi:replicative DNA helicase